MNEDEEDTPSHRKQLRALHREKLTELCAPLLDEKEGQGGEGDSADDAKREADLQRRELDPK